jgi:branched-chain amino acid transport system permease protein
LFGPQAQGYPKPDGLTGRFDIFGIPVLKTQLLAILGAVVLMAFLYWFVNRTKRGRAMRAVGEDREIAALMGIDVDRTIVTTFAIGGLLAGAAGVFWALNFGQVTFDMGFIPGIKAFTAAVLGGIGNIRGALFGGLALGLIENLSTLCIGTQWKNPIAFGVLVAVLVFRPTGILGEGLSK